MRPIRLAILLTLSLSLTACGGFRTSRLNPLNWFGKAEPVAVALVPEEKEDPRPYVQQVLEMKVESISTGAIVTAKGLPPTQGWYKAELVPREVDADGKLVLEFRIVPPKEPTRTSTQFSREITAAHYLTVYELALISQIVVQSETNALSSRR